MKNFVAPCRVLFGLLPAALVLFQNGCASSNPAATKLPPCCQNRAAQILPGEAGASISDLASTWETDSGPTLHLAELNGRVRLISMFYATCEGVCVITKQDMQAIEASLPASVRERVGFILVTLDPRRDSLAALRSYRRTEGLAKDRWTLLRGDDAATAKLASVLGVASGRDAAGRFVHSSELVVLDASGRIIHRHAGLRADLQAIATEIEAAALAPSVTLGPVAARH